MNLVSFNNSITDAKNLLKEFGLFKANGIKNVNKDGVSDEFRTASIKNSYFKAYLAGVEHYDFDILLKDQSFLQFQFTENEGVIDLRYSYFQNPVEFVDYETYVKEQILIYKMQESVEEVGMLLEQEYNQFLNEQELNSNFTTIRYDVDYPNYKPLIHSVSHLHIGHNNHLRVPLDKIISPVKFVLFVIKHAYYYDWKDKIESGHDMNLFFELCKKGELTLDAKVFHELEKSDMYLT